MVTGVIHPAGSGTFFNSPFTTQRLALRI